MEIILIWLVCAVVTAIIASAKGRFGFGWFFVGLLLGIFGLILIACLPSKNPVRVAYAPPEPAAKQFKPLFVEDNTKACPDCGESVLKVANVCKHCGFRFSPPSG